MAMQCCRKEYAKVCEIRVSVDASASFNYDLCLRLRFGLLASSWLPRPLGNFLWSALHVMLLIVGGPILWALVWLAAFLFFSVFATGSCVIWTCICFAGCGLCLVAVDLVVLPFQLLRLCWSLVACREPIVDWWWSAFCAVEFWENFKSAVWDPIWCFFPAGVPCMRRSMYQETKDQQLDQKLKTWARWFQEVMLMHEAITL